MSVPLSQLRPLMGRLSDLKRVRTAQYPGESFTGVRFCTAWAGLSRGVSVARVARQECAAALAAVELSGISPPALRRGGLSVDRVAEVFARAIDTSGAVLPAALRTDLRTHAPSARGDAEDSPPAFCAELCNQPRAGATHPTKQRLILEPAESHADHCYGVAVLGALLTAHYGGDPAVPFLAGLAHHLHNAVLPDGGFAAEELLGDDYPKIVEKLTADALAELPPELAARVRDALDRCLPYPDSPEAKCFHAADVIDRVLEVVYFDRVARFRLSTAIDELELVHPGPFRAFQNETLLAAGVLG